MGEQFLADLRNPFRNVTVSRKRALQLFAAAIAVVAPSQIPQSAEARKHRKPPQAFVAGVLADAGPGSPGSLDWTFHGVVVTETGSQFKLDTPFVLSATATTDEVRHQAVVQVRSKAAAALQGHGFDVPEDRIAVTLP